MKSINKTGLQEIGQLRPKHQTEDACHPVFGGKSDKSLNHPNGND